MKWDLCKALRTPYFRCNSNHWIRCDFTGFYTWSCICILSLPSSSLSPSVWDGKSKFGDVIILAVIPEMYYSRGEITAEFMRGCCAKKTNMVGSCLSWIMVCIMWLAVLVKQLMTVTEDSVWRSVNEKQISSDDYRGTVLAITYWEHFVFPFKSNSPLICVKDGVGREPTAFQACQDVSQRVIPPAAGWVIKTHQ